MSFCDQHLSVIVDLEVVENVSHIRIRVRNQCQTSHKALLWVEQILNLIK